MAAFCSVCGHELGEDARFCSGCGTQVYRASIGLDPGHSDRLIRPRLGRRLGGVCLAYARAYGWEVATVRILAIIVAVVGAPLSWLAYCAAWIIIPEEPLMPFVSRTVSSSSNQPLTEVHPPFEGK